MIVSRCLSNLVSKQLLMSCRLERVDSLWCSLRGIGNSGRGCLGTKLVEKFDVDLVGLILGLAQQVLVI